MVNICSQVQCVNKTTNLLLDIAVVWSKHVWSMILLQDDLYDDIVYSAKFAKLGHNFSFDSQKTPPYLNP